MRVIECDTVICESVQGTVGCGVTDYIATRMLGLSLNKASACDVRSSGLVDRFIGCPDWMDARVRLYEGNALQPYSKADNFVSR
jgi:hypothetical protein